MKFTLALAWGSLLLIPCLLWLLGVAAVGLVKMAAQRFQPRRCFCCGRTFFLGTAIPPSAYRRDRWLCWLCGWLST